MNKRELIEHINNTLFDNLKDTLFTEPTLSITESAKDNKVAITFETKKGSVFVGGMLKKFEKVTVPQFVADWIEKNRGSLFGLNYDSVSSEIYDWVYEEEEEGNLKKLHLACAIGYTVEKEKRYTVKMRSTKQPLFYNNMYEKTFFSLGDLATRFTRKQLEELGLGWVFDCPGIEIEKVEE